MISEIFKRKFYLFTLLLGLFFIFSFTMPTSEAHVLIIADGKGDNPDLIPEADNTANALTAKGYKVKKLYRTNATTKNIMKGMYNADAVIYLGHGGYQTGHYNYNTGGYADPPFALVGSDDFIWGIDDKIREGWNGKQITAPFKSNIPVILAHACFSTGYVENVQVSNPVTTIYNFSRMFTGAGANYYATAYYGSYNNKQVVDIVDEFLEGATSFSEANDQNSVKISSYTLKNGVKIWRSSSGKAAFVGDWSATFPSASQTTAYDDAAAEAWYQSYVLGNIDLTSPIIKSTNPANTATDVSPTSPVTVTFSENIQQGTNFSGIYLKNTNNGVEIPLSSITINGNVLTLDNLNLLYSTDYQLYIPAGAVQDASGNILVSAYNLIFKTAEQDLTPPTVSCCSPADGATGIGLTTPITITFNENILQDINFSGIYITNLSTSNTVSIASKSISGKVLTLTTASRVLNNLYQVFIPDGAVKDSAGNSLISDYVYSFTSTNDATPPKVSSTKPANGATGVSLTSSIVITFTENIKASSNISKIYIKNLSTGKIVPTSLKTISGRTLSLKLKYSRLKNNLYQVYIPAGAVKDLIGNKLASSYSFKFRTMK